MCEVVDQCRVVVCLEFVEFGVVDDVGDDFVDWGFEGCFFFCVLGFVGGFEVVVLDCG